MFLFVTFDTALMILDIVSPLNESRVHLQVKVEYFVDQQKYYYLFMWHMTICTSITLITLLSTAFSCYSYASHICAMFKVAK